MNDLTELPALVSALLERLTYPLDEEAIVALRQAKILLEQAQARHSLRPAMRGSGRSGIPGDIAKGVNP